MRRVVWRETGEGVRRSGVSKCDDCLTFAGGSGALTGVAKYKGAVCCAPVALRLVSCAG